MVEVGVGAVGTLGLLPPALSPVLYFHSSASITVSRWFIIDLFRVRLRLPHQTHSAHLRLSHFTNLPCRHAPRSLLTASAWPATNILPYPVEKPFNKVPCRHKVLQNQSVSKPRKNPIQHLVVFSLFIFFLSLLIRKVNKCYRGRSCPVIVHCRYTRKCEIENVPKSSVTQHVQVYFITFNPSVMEQAGPALTSSLTWCWTEWQKVRITHQLFLVQYGQQRASVIIMCQICRSVLLCSSD